MGNAMNLAKQIEEFCRNSEYEFYSVRGISIKLQISDGVLVREVLESQPNLFRRSYFKSREGNTLYALAEKPIKGKERFLQFAHNLTKFS